jgi:hypothetical protein
MERTFFLDECLSTSLPAQRAALPPLPSSFVAFIDARLVSTALIQQRFLISVLSQ